MASKKHRPDPRRGDVWRVDFPNRPDDPHLPRPAIVISNDRHNEFADTVLVIPVFNDDGLPKLLPTHIPIAKGTAGLTKNSRAMCEHIASIGKDRLVGTALGVMPSVVLTALVQGIKKAVE
jgi:mRNA-degrading endonuclease toxin of MazEF toxin-antitoxin module